MTTTTQPDRDALGFAVKKEAVRADILRYASNFASGTNTSDILQIARTLMAWIEEAGDDRTDYQRRFTAVQQVHANHQGYASLWMYAQKPEMFLDEAVALYGFLAA